jgi:hypothetical protein
VWLSAPRKPAENTSHSKYDGAGNSLALASSRGEDEVSSLHAEVPHPLECFFCALILASQMAGQQHTCPQIWQSAGICAITAAGGMLRKISTPMMNRTRNFLTGAFKHFPFRD